MAIDITPAATFRPAFLRLAPSILDAARPQLEPVGYNQRYEFVGPINPLERTNETSPTYLRAFVDAPNEATISNEPLSIGTLGREELDFSRAALQPQGQQLGLFGGEEDQTEGIGLRPQGLSQYASIQAGESRLGARGSLSIDV